MQTVAAGAGLTLVLQLALAVEGRSELGLRFVPFPKPEPARTICLAWRRGSSRGDELRLLAEQLIQNVPRAQRILRPRPGWPARGPAKLRPSARARPCDAARGWGGAC